jgi:predicted DNA-binding transcriptional regulator AlpA
VDSANRDRALQARADSVRDFPGIKHSHTDDDLQLLSREDLTDAPEVTQTQATINRVLGKGPRIPRPKRQGLLAMSEATFDRMVRSGLFPPPIHIGPRMLRWPVRVVREWIERQPSSTTI